MVDLRAIMVQQKAINRGGINVTQDLRLALALIFWLAGEYGFGSLGLATAVESWGTMK
jgi:hypothetical protein